MHDNATFTIAWSLIGLVCIIGVGILISETIMFVSRFINRDND